MRYLSNSLSETEHLAQIIGKIIKPGDTIAFAGGMGAGKTTFTKNLVKNMGYSGYVSSPTFTIVNEYITNDCSIYHFDFYRLTDPDDLYSTGYYDYVDGNNILIIEWSENIEDELPENTIKISINRISDNSREFIIDGGDRFEDIGN